VARPNDVQKTPRSIFIIGVDRVERIRWARQGVPQLTFRIAVDLHCEIAKRPPRSAAARRSKPAALSSS